MFAILFGYVFASQTWLFIGDSLTEGYGLSKESAFPAKLEKLWNEKHPDDTIQVFNAGVSGATSAIGPQTLRFYLKKDVDVVFVALGANDGLRGQPIKALEKNLENVISLSKEKQLSLVLLGMRIPTNYGQEYTKEFTQLYSKLAKKHDLLLYPFLLEGVAANKDLNLKDGIHPNEKGYSLIAEKLYKFIRKNYDKIKSH
tara:strand:+ start:571 stop:1170 length:600 start_codon:yes stop_codon:yes gene_type:complete